jgi:hypothetical protein
LDSEPSVFIAVYTNECKAYCDAAFFASLEAFTYPSLSVHVVDNSLGVDYTSRLKRLVPASVEVAHIDVPRDHPQTQFLRNVAVSLDTLRQSFLKGVAPWFLILESDVIAPPDAIERLLDAARDFDVVGGVYYEGFHPSEWFSPSHDEIIPAGVGGVCGTVLSGCTLYSREAVARVPFRWSYDNLAAFPDAWFSLDAGWRGFRLSHTTGVKCLHLHDDQGLRGLQSMR